MFEALSSHSRAAPQRIDPAGLPKPSTLRWGFLPFLIEYIGYTIGFGYIYLRHCDNPMSQRSEKISCGSNHGPQAANCGGFTPSFLRIKPDGFGIDEQAIWIYNYPNRGKQTAIICSVKGFIMTASKIRLQWLLLAFALLQVVCFSARALSGPQKRIEIYKPNPAYWQYDGKPVLLLGGDKD